MNIKELSENLGLEEDEYRELIDLFIASGGGDFQKIVAGMAAGDADQVMRAAHTIKGAAGNLGLVDVSAAAKVIEARAMNNQLGELGAAVRALEGLIKQIEDEAGA
ncbi:MAG: Hpt domain-containing protein [Desulfobacterales bacterium]|nr:Hpt domain-containing protein [Desulfobacterales bacterium]